MPKEKVKLGFRFSQIWLENQQYQFWLLEDKTDSAKFYWLLCKDSVSLSNMGIGDEISHSLSKKS